MKPLFIQGIFYSLATPILFSLVWRFYIYYKSTESKVAKLFIYPAILGGINVFSLAILDFFFPYHPTLLMIRQTGVAILHMLIFIALFRIVLYLKFPQSLKKQIVGLLIYLIPVIIYLILVFTLSESPTINPQGFIHWGHPSSANYLKIFIATGTLISLAVIFFQKIKTKKIRSFFLGVSCLAGLAYFALIYLFKEEGSLGELFLIAFLSLVLLLVLLTRGKTIIRETMYISENEEKNK